MSETVKISLRGRDYLLRTQGDQERIQAAAALVEERLSGLDDSVSVDTRDRFILAMLNLAGEYLQVKQRCHELETEALPLQTEMQTAEEELTLAEAALIARIDAALNDSPPR